jgi:hypothetical protein
MNKANVQFHTRVNLYALLTARTEMVRVQAQDADEETRRHHGRETTTD